MRFIELNDGMWIQIPDNGVMVRGRTWLEPRRIELEISLDNVVHSLARIPMDTPLRDQITQEEMDFLATALAAHACRLLTGSGKMIENRWQHLVSMIASARDCTIHLEWKDVVATELVGESAFAGSTEIWTTGGLFRREDIIRYTLDRTAGETDYALTAHTKDNKGIVYRGTMQECSHAWRSVASRRGSVVFHDQLTEAVANMSGVSKAILDRDSGRAAARTPGRAIVLEPDVR